MAPVALQNVSDLGDRPIDTRTYVVFDTVAAFHTGTSRAHGYTLTSTHLEFAMRLYPKAS